MAEWEINRDIEDMDPVLTTIRSLFLTGTIKKMYQLIGFGPTKIARLLGLNYNSYHDKLKDPGKFTQLHILTLAYAAGINPLIIQDVIQHEIIDEVERKVVKFEKKEKVKKSRG